MTAAVFVDGSGGGGGTYLLFGGIRYLRVITPGQNLYCYAVRYGHKRGVFMNWRDTQQQTTGYKGMSLCGAM